MQSTKIFIYLFKTKLIYILISLLILTTTVLIIDFIELTRVNINKENFSLEKIILMSILKIPYIINEITPFIIIISTAFFFKNLIDNNELVSMRNLGLSILNVFYPVGCAVFITGLISLLLINPASSVFMNYYEKIETEKDGLNNIVKLSGEEIWIKNKFDDNIIYINANSININKMKLNDVMIVNDNSLDPTIIFAKNANIINKELQLIDVEQVKIKSNVIENFNKLNLPIDFTRKDIVNSLEYYKHTSFYNYYNYVNSMKKLNYLSNEIILYFISEIFKPLLLISICFVVTGYVSKFNRNETFFKTIFVAIIIGFIIFLINKFIHSINIKTLYSYFFVILSIPVISLVLGTILIVRVEKN
ncbi:MAG: hypothetical protein CFH21_00907 [Alphaproteobacteria bacterium MarineAlpha5_Bin11]|nr:MAG: hypothetical protein CFH21_00907 [Alphaproteobacteria bacterium MarineAlpha5_Bin11]